MASTRLRLTAYSLASLRHRNGSRHPRAPGHLDGGRAALRRLAGELDDFYDRVAVQVGRPAHGAPPPAEVPVLAGLSAAGQSGGDDIPLIPYHPHELWVREHLHHLAQHVAAVPAPAQHIAELRRTPGGAERPAVLE